MTKGARFYTALDNCMQRSDQLETECLKDIESARMFRLAEKRESHIPCVHKTLYITQIVNKARDCGG